MTAVSDESEPLFAAFRIVAHEIGVDEVRAPLGYDGGEPLAQLAAASALRVRRLALQGAWWRSDHGSLIGYRASDNRPVAVLRRGSSYEMHDALSGGMCVLTDDNAADLSPHGHCLYRPFPARALTLGDLVRFAWTECRTDAWRFVGLCTLFAALTLAPAAVVGALLREALPANDEMALYALVIILLGIAAAAALFSLAQTILQVRIDGRLSLALQTAMWDRLLRLSPRFFSGYSTGDLYMRADMLAQMQSKLIPAAQAMLLGLLTCIFNFVAMYVYAPDLATMTSMMALAMAIVAGGCIKLRLVHERERRAADGSIFDMLLQHLQGISKLRGAGRESRAIERWAQEYPVQQFHAHRSDALRAVVVVLSAVVPALWMLMIFATAGFSEPQERMAAARFVPFFMFGAAFLLAFSAALTALVSALDAIPLYERVQPLLAAEPEISGEIAVRGRVSGRIDVLHLSFRYDPEGEDVLHDVTFSATPGECIAIVGESGSGKSTLLRLLIGLETPPRGAVFYDGCDFARADRDALRRQFGVVLQHGSLFIGDILANIVGASETLTREDALAAARLCGLAEDIEALPMGLQTVLTDGGTVLSGGQRQRIMIARAVAHRPAILFLDEATSALDNERQAQVMGNLRSLQSTLIVIAHRLSSIASADRILVMDRGRIVQSGTFAQLRASDGVFARMALRQMS